MKALLTKLIRGFNETPIENTKNSKMKQLYCVQTSNVETKPLTRLSLKCLATDAQNWAKKANNLREIVVITF